MLSTQHVEATHELSLYLPAGANISVQARSYCAAGLTATPRARAAVKAQ